MESYREHIYRECTETDMNNKDEVTKLIQMLAHDCTEHYDIMQILEKKLQDLMSYTDYVKFATENAQEIFKREVSGMAEGEFKDFILDHMEEILRGDGI